MRDFEDPSGKKWTAAVRELHGSDYKGRWVLVLTPPDGEPEVVLPEVRWNSARVAESALAVMSLPELRRRVRAAAGRLHVAAGR